MNKKAPKRLGIMGGMGPMATVDFYQKITELTPATCDQDHIPLIIDSYPQIEDRTAFILGRGDDPCPKMIESAQRLKQAGAEAILITCNTAHYFAERIQQTVDIDIIHIVKSAVRAIVDANSAGEHYQRIAVLATDGTVKSGLYQHELERVGLTVVALSDAQQKSLMSCIYDGAKTGKIADYQADFEAIIDAVPADAYIAACTEIPLFAAQLSDDYPIIDATQTLAEQAVRFALSSE